MSTADPPTGSVLAQPRFRAVFLAQTTVEVADQFLLVALAWAILSAAGGDTLGLVLAAWAVPRGLFLLFGGVLVDRVDRRLVALVCGTALAMVVGGIAWLAAAGHGPRGGWLAVWLAAAVLLGLLDGVRLPLGYSLIPLVVAERDVLDANRWSQLRLWATLTVGPAGGGALTALLGAGGALAVTGVLYLLGGLLLLRLPSLKVEREEPSSIVRDFVAGLLVVRTDERLRLLLPVFAVVNLFVLGILTVGIPLLVQRGLAGSAQELGLVTGTFGVGLMVGTALVPKLLPSLTSRLGGLFSLFVLSDVFLAVTGAMPSVTGVCVTFGLSGFFIGPASAGYQAVLQTSTPPEYLGRVVSLSRATSFGLEPLSAGMAGLVSRTVTAGAIVVVGGTAAALVDAAAIVRGRVLDRRGAQRDAVGSTGGS